MPYYAACVKIHIQVLLQEVVKIVFRKRKICVRSTGISWQGYREYI